MKPIPIIAAALTASLLMFSLPSQAFGLFGSDRQHAETELSEDDPRPKRGRHTPVPHEKPGRRKGTAKEAEPHGKESKTTAETAAVSAGFSWYATHGTGGKRLPQPGEIPSIAEHGGYYLGADEPVVYLTFDAGYENGNVAKILDGLKAEHVPGAFFILENLAERNPDLVKRMADEGHLVCNHSARHKDMSAFSESEFKEELGRMEAAYRQATGRELARYYRPPEGRFTIENLDWAKAMGYSTVLWSFAYADWDNEKQPDPTTALAKILSGAHNGMVLLLHPTSATNAEILPALIRNLKEMGYRFGTLDELTGGGGFGA